ncbi:sulfatase-like hydrolase/transferase [Haloarcula sp. AONF1]
MDSPNVLLVILDSVRARNMSLYGSGARTTPFLERFADEAEVYEQARAPSIHSVASHASIFTGYHVPEHGVTKHESELDPESTIWNELAADYGYETGIFTPNVVVGVSSNLTEPFQTVDGPRQDPGHRYFEAGITPSDIEGHQTNREYLTRCFNSDAPLRSVINGLYFQYYDGGTEAEDESATEYIDSFLDWSGSQNGPWAACLNLMDAHYPYEPMSEYDQWGGSELQALHDSLSAPPSREIVTNGDWWKLRAVESLYDGCIRQLDAAMEYLTAALEERGDLDDTLLVITSDHGEGFGERSRIDPRVQVADHSWGISEVQTHVPLVVRRPGESDGVVENRIASLTRFPDVVRDEVAGERGSFTVDDRAIAMTHRLEQPERVLPSSCQDRSKYGGPWRAVYRQAGDDVRKDADHGSTARTVLIEDAQVSYPRDDEEPSLETVYDSFEDKGVRKDQADGQALDDDVEQQLEELGYLR